MSEQPDWAGYAEWEAEHDAKQQACPHQRTSADTFGDYGTEFATGIYCTDCDKFLGVEYG